VPDDYEGLELDDKVFMVFLRLDSLLGKIPSLEKLL